MTQDLFRQDAYLTECSATVTAIHEHGIVLDRSVFYPLGGGQAGDAGELVRLDGTVITIADTRKGKDAEGRPTADIVHVPSPGQEALLATLQPGTALTARIDYARLDLALTDQLDKDMLTAGIAALVAAAHPVHIGAITDAELDANPSLVKSMSVSPPRGSGTGRTVRTGETTLIDLQPCGGTHVANTAEIGRVVVTKIEKKSATTRRVVLGFQEAPPASPSAPPP